MTTAAAAGSSSFCDTEINILFLNPLALGTAPQWLGWLLLNYPTQSLKGPAKASAQVFPWIIEQLQDQHVLERARVANWDIWIVSDS